MNLPKTFIKDAHEYFLNNDSTISFYYIEIIDEIEYMMYDNGDYFIYDDYNEEVSLFAYEVFISQNDVWMMNIIDK